MVVFIALPLASVLLLKSVLSFAGWTCKLDPSPLALLQLTISGPQSGNPPQEERVDCALDPQKLRLIEGHKACTFETKIFTNKNDYLYGFFPLQIFGAQMINHLVAAHLSGAL